MSSLENDDLKTLYNRLIDSRDGYANAAEHADGPTETLFSQRASQRAQYAAELRTILTQRGEQIEEDGSILASAHRVFTSLRAAVGDGTDAIAAEVERGERHLLEAYDEALDEAPDTDPAFPLLAQQRSDVQHTLEMTRRS